VRSWTAASGVITNVYEFDDDQGGWVDFVVQFTDEGGLEHVLPKSRHKTPPYPYVEGKPIPLIYPPGEPDRARPSIPHHLYRNYENVMIMSLAAAGLFLFVLMVGHRIHWSPARDAAILISRRNQAHVRRE